ncbi:MAG: tetratricopeptide repeat protein, partial [Dehalococcoidia bacterium]|nr:tetratricopeptide repeat protein [Dehalococcoidia bacterium]
PVEQFQWFAAASLAFLVLGSVVERARLRFGRETLVLAGATIALVLLSSCATDAYTLNEQGRDAMQAGDYDRAIILFQEAQAEEPDNAGITLNLAGALHAAGRYDEAQLTARRVLGSNRSAVRARAHASIGHHRFATQDLAGALESFRAALLADPGDEDSRHDYEVVLRLLTQQGEEPGQQDGAGQDGAQPGETPPPGQEDQGETPGEEAPPGEQTPGAGEAGPGDQQGPPGSLAEIQARIDAIDAQIAELMDEGEPPSTEEAIRILDLLAERARLAGSRDGLDTSGDPGDY